MVRSYNYFDGALLSGAPGTIQEGYMERSIKNLCIGLMLFALVGCASIGSDKLPTQQGSHGVLVGAYKIDVGDQVSISVWKNPELSISEPVRPDGKIAVHLLGDIEAAGKTPEELAKDIESGLSNYIMDPNVTVILTGLAGQAFLSRIRVTGAVGNNTSLTYHQGMTVLDAVLDAGSVGIYADANRTKLHRRTESGTETYNIRLKDILENGDMTTNVDLAPGDVITVPESIF
jgi:polysaccharide export outer membrane protein